MDLDTHLVHKGLEVLIRPQETKDGPRLYSQATIDPRGTKAQAIALVHAHATQLPAPFHLVQVDSDQRAVGGDAYLMGTEGLHAIGFGEILHGIRPLQPLVCAHRQHEATRQYKVKDTRDHQAQPDRRNREEREGGHPHILGQGMVRGQDQVVEQNQGTRTDHGHGTTQDGAETHGHE